MDRAGVLPPIGSRAGCAAGFPVISIGWLVSETYTKLFGSITASTVWSEPYATRVVWVTMLAMADRNGDVFASIPGLARYANVTLAEAEAALQSFLSPDPYSRTEDSEGRRVEVVDGGWKLLNHAKFGAIRNADERAEYKREWDRANRGNRPNSSHRSTPDNPRQPPTNPTGPTTLTPSLTPDKSKRSSCSTGVERFAEFWAAYPRKVGKAAALKVWRKIDPDPETMKDILTAVEVQRESDQWCRDAGQFIPHPATWLNGRRWEDEAQVPGRSFADARVAL
jgi:hypothetical protein